jgi:hypothetical protein
MTELIVVGAGIAGSCVARMARERGWGVTVVADGGRPDSLAATAVLRRGYHAGRSGELEAWDYAVGVYAEWGVRMKRGGAVASYRRPLGGEVEDRDWLLLDPAEPLVKADVTREVLSAHGGRVWFGRGDGLAAAGGGAGGAVVVAAGARGALAPSGAVTWGVTWLHAPDALRAASDVRVYQYAPYRTIVGGVAGGRARVGSSSSVSEEGAVAQARKMLGVAWDLGWLTTQDGWEMRVGMRVKTDSTWRRAEDGHWEIGGFHRTGYALAPMAAKDVLDDIEKNLT